MAKADPQHELQQLIERTKKAGQNLFTFTAEAEIINRDKGVYAYLLAKPARRLASALSLDRELLVLLSFYTDQQQRTIKTARDLIMQYEGRLESTVVIIVHNDSEGNSKLPKWGRSIGIAVLPIYAPKMPTHADDLERYLCHELFSHDPFDVTGPVSDDDNFFGRRNEALDLARKLQTGQIRSCLGIRKIGKTSVINRVIREARQSHDCYCVMLDCSRDQIWCQTAEELMTALAEAIEVAIQSPQKYATVSAPAQLANLSDASSRLLTIIRKAEKPVLIFIDEVDYVTPGSPTAAHWADYFNPFWRNFRAVYQEALRDSKTISVMVVGVSSKWFSVGSVGGIENAALAFIPEEYLSPLARGASVAMVRKIARSAGLIFEDRIADIISAACSDMPFWVRKACSYIHRHIDVAKRPITMDATAVRQYVADFIEQEGATLAQVALSHLFRVYPELERPSLACLSDGNEKITTAHALILRRYGVLAP